MCLRHIVTSPSPAKSDVMPKHMQNICAINKLSCPRNRVLEDLEKWLTWETLEPIYPITHKLCIQGSVWFKNSSMCMQPSTNAPGGHICIYAQPHLCLGRDRLPLLLSHTVKALTNDKPDHKQNNAENYVNSQHKLNFPWPCTANKLLYSVPIATSLQIVTWTLCRSTFHHDIKLMIFVKCFPTVFQHILLRKYLQRIHEQPGSWTYIQGKIEPNMETNCCK